MLNSRQLLHTFFSVVYLGRPLFCSFGVRSLRACFFIVRDKSLTFYCCSRNFRFVTTFLTVLSCRRSSYVTFILFYVQTSLRSSSLLFGQVLTFYSTTFFMFYDANYSLRSLLFTSLYRATFTIFTFVEVLQQP